MRLSTTVRNFVRQQVKIIGTEDARHKTARHCSWCSGVSLRSSPRCETQPFSPTYDLFYLYTADVNSLKRPRNNNVCPFGSWNDQPEIRSRCRPLLSVETGPISRPICTPRLQLNLSLEWLFYNINSRPGNSQIVLHCIVYTFLCN